MKSALYGIYALVFISENSLVRFAHSFFFWSVNNLRVNNQLQELEGTGTSFVYWLDWKSKHFNWNVTEWKATQPSWRVEENCSNGSLAKVANFHWKHHNFVACLESIQTLYFRWYLKSYHFAIYLHKKLLFLVKTLEFEYLGSSNKAKTTFLFPSPRDGIGSRVGIGSARSVTIQCKSKIGIGSGVGSSTESESEGSGEFLILPIPRPLPSLPIQWAQGERNRNRKRNYQPIKKLITSSFQT